MMSETELQPQANPLSLIDEIDVGSVQGTLSKIARLQTVIQSTLKSGHDYDVIPGTGKPTLLKPGAEKVLMLFGITSEYDLVEKIEDYEKGIFAFTFKCTLLKSGQKITEGLGSCNSKEDKYRWRLVKEEDVPSGIDLSTLKSRTNNYGQKKYRIENDDTYSLANTILKMAKKRAQIDATLTVASLSEIFTQDIEDMKQFAQAEHTENMTVEDAGNIQLKFGKHKGKSLKDLFRSERSYLEWLAGTDRTDPIIKKAINIIFDASKKTAESNRTQTEQKKEDPKPVETQPSAESKDPFANDGKPIDISDDDLPF
ncbi:hypothetical protein ACFP7A_01355 [Sporolactobacillus kofuensis]|uniref:Exodeoxyribonuclease X-like C-terminal domain-containing protein n=1 Tax=Sporolactobacillus kofuensis TaxID=269672 RepID=A0ABW1WD76_9BACL